LLAGACLARRFFFRHDALLTFKHTAMTSLRWRRSPPSGFDLR
jgi:hypothetical protein